MNNSRAKHWAFTINNPSHEIDHLAVEPTVSYAVWQLEEGENGTPHFQGYLILTTALSLRQLKNILQDDTAHLEVCKGSPEQNRAYCTKPETRIGEFSEIGIFPEKGQGKRTDLVKLHSALKDGLNHKQYAADFFELWVRYPHLVTHFQCAQSSPRDETQPTACFLLLGKPGLGKSTFARVLARRESERYGGTYFNKQPGKWWDGYNGERVVLLDDFRGHSMSFTDFKHAVDTFAIRVEIKTTTCHLEAKCFIITSNESPEDWWQKEVTRGSETAIFRRITEVFYFEELGLYRHYLSYDGYASDYKTPRGDASAFVIQTPLQQASRT